MVKTGKGLPRSLQNVDFGDFDIPVTPATTSVVGGVKKAAPVTAPPGITAAAGVKAVAVPTKAEFDALVEEYNKLLTNVTDLRVTVVKLVVALKDAGTVS